MLPFVAGLALAYLLDPLADRLERLGVGRLAATLIILDGLVVGLVGLLLAVPVAASIGVLVRFGVERHLKGRLYLAHDPVLLTEPEE